MKTFIDPCASDKPSKKYKHIDNHATCRGNGRTDGLRTHLDCIKCNKYMNDEKMIVVWNPNDITLRQKVWWIFTKKVTHHGYHAITIVCNHCKYEHTPEEYKELLRKPGAWVNNE